jgi:hypothetical protein
MAALDSGLLQSAMDIAPFRSAAQQASHGNCYLEDILMERILKS